jgi:shikimate kinase
MPRGGDDDARPPVKADANIVLVGFMGTGKSTVGRLLAARLGRPFVDMDEEIERRAGRPIPEIFAREGEPAFRRLERALVRELSARSGLVIAPGGGIVLDPANVADFARSGLVACLAAAPATILARVGQDPHRPLLQGGDPLGRIVALLDRRRDLYEAIPFRIDTDGLAPEAVAERVLARFRETEP